MAEPAANRAVPAPAPANPSAESPPEASSRLRRFATVLANYARKHAPQRTPRIEAAPEPPRVKGSHAAALTLLRIIPWVLGGVFVFSFYWDFPGQAITLFGQTVSVEGLLRILSVSGFIGFLTNWLAISMLFHPRQRRPILGQGLIPAQRERVIFRLAKAVSEELISPDLIKQKIEESGIIPRYRVMMVEVARNVVEDADFRREVKALAADYARETLSSPELRQRIVSFTVDKLETFAGKGLAGVALRTYRLLGEQDFQRRIEEAVAALPEAVDTLLDGFDRQLDALPARIDAHSEALERWATRAVLDFVESFDIYSIVTENMRRYDEQQLENLLKNTSNEQLNYIKYLGGVLGAVGGFVIWQPLLALGVLGAIVLGAWALDALLLRLGATKKARLG